MQGGIGSFHEINSIEYGNKQKHNWKKRHVIPKLDTTNRRILKLGKSNGKFKVKNRYEGSIT
jgi:hypothetical protein